VLLLLLLLLLQALHWLCKHLGTYKHLLNASLLERSDKRAAHPSLCCKPAGRPALYQLCCVHYYNPFTSCYCHRFCYSCCCYTAAAVAACVQL
jgi:hypothetical protein